MIRLNIDPASPTPMYQQLKQLIIIEIMSDRLASGDSLPSIRELARILKLNPNTVAKVYYNLEEEGYIEGHRGSGYTVKPTKPKIDNFKIRILEDEFKHFLEKAFAMGFTKKDINELFGRLLNNE